jgi:hypothetical protein
LSSGKIRSPYCKPHARITYGQQSLKKQALDYTLRARQAVANATLGRVDPVLKTTRTSIADGALGAHQDDVADATKSCLPVGFVVLSKFDTSA